MTPMSPYETGDIKSASGTPSPPTVCNNTLTNFLSIQTNSTSDTLASLQNVGFRSDDYIISDLLCQRMHEDHDPELIKTESNELQDTIFDNPRRSSQIHCSLSMFLPPTTMLGQSFMLISTLEKRTIPTMVPSTTICNYVTSCN
jgi:hypothetical protein